MLVFEDLHWADDAMLAFLEHLADRAEGVPLLVVGTARPELYERHRGLRGGLRNANTINLVAALGGGDRPPGLGAAGGERRSPPSCSSRSSIGPAATRCMPRSSSGS